jgi:2-polyprenyl-3-methyl-5-hydroxy-6-metoxy-1,4-benzoquinol methylase
MLGMTKDYKGFLVNGILSKKSKYFLKKSKYGHFYIHPMPSQKRLTNFYREDYLKDAFKVAAKGMDIGNKDKLERFHYDRQYAEIEKFAKETFNRKDIKILDVGSGMGGVLDYFKKRGFTNLYGIEPGALKKRHGIKIFNSEFLDFETEELFDFILFKNVLEHVRNPVRFLKKAHRLLKKNGFIRVQVPNDFSYTQYRAVCSMKKKKYYFFNPPEHLHYFDFNSMAKMLQGCGFMVTKKTTDWSMDIFMLMGLDYANDQSIGRLCHQYRINFEYWAGADFLTHFYEKMAEAQIGRCVIEYAKKM